MTKNFYRISFLIFSILLSLSCEKSEIEDDLETEPSRAEERNYSSDFPESITFYENSTEAVLLDIKNENEIENISTLSTVFRIEKLNNLWYISPKDPFDYETTSNTQVKIKVTDKLGNKEEREIKVNITDVDESVATDEPNEESSSLKFPLTIKTYLKNNELYSIQSFQYDQLDRQIRYDMNYSSLPNNDYYTTTNYSGSTVTTESYYTETNELGGYNITNNSSSKKPITVSHYLSDNSLYTEQKYQYDELDRQIRYDIIYPSLPNNDYYMITDYSENKATSKSYHTQTNELTGYNITISSPNNNPMVIEYYLDDDTLYSKQIFQYDEFERQIRYDIIYPSLPDNDYYIVTTFSENIATSSSYSTLTNEIEGYIVTTYKE